MPRVWFNKTFSSIHSALSLIRRADAAGGYELVCSSPNPRAVGLLAAHRAAAEPSGLTGSPYLEWCVGFCRRERIDIFVPGKEASLMARHHADFAEVGTRVLSAAAPQTLDLLHDKARFYAAAKAASAPSPAFRVFETADAFNQAYDELSVAHARLCIKPAVSVYGIGFRQIVEDTTPFSLLLDGNPYRIDLKSLRAMLAEVEDCRTMLLMPYLGGHEFSVDCVADHGRLVCAVARRKSRAAGGGQTIVVREDILCACRDLTAQFELNGNVNIQFREGDTGLHILEINPRMSGGIAMACLAGPNLPHLALEVFRHGADAVTVPAIEDGLCVGEVTEAVRLPC